MAGLESEVRHLGEQFKEHEGADERRHRETIDALSGLRIEVSRIGAQVDSNGRVPVMQRDAFGGMNVREAVSTIGIVLALVSLLVSAVRGEHVDPKQLEQIVQATRTEAAPAPVPTPGK